MKDLGGMDRDMEREYSNLRMEIATMEIGKKVNFMEKEFE